MNRKMIVGLGLALAALTGCFGVKGTFSFTRPSVKAALYVGKGAHGVSAYRWLELTTFAEDLDTTLVDAEQIQSGALDGQDVLIVPDGCADAMALALGADGAREIGEFVRDGGGYVGTGAGALLVSESTSSHPGALGLIPFASRAGAGRADMEVRFNARATGLAGIAKGLHRVAYAAGPVFAPSLPVDGAEFEIIAAYDSDIGAWTGRDVPSMAGQAAVVAGQVGKGAVFASAVQPEIDLADHDILEGALRFVTGREIAWQIPQRRRGQLAVGIDMAAGFTTAAAAAQIRKTMLERRYDLIPVDADILCAGMSHHLDVTVRPDAEGFAKIAQVAALPNEAFGHVVDAPRGHTRKQVAILADGDGAEFAIADRLELSPEFEVTFVNGADVANGALKGKDLLVCPGAWDSSLCEALGEKGCEAIGQFVREGGSYYGLCAGAVAAGETASDGRPCASLVPWKVIGERSCRGRGPITVKLTEEGLAHFGSAHTNRCVTYLGGPMFEPGNPVAGADIRPWATYSGYGLCPSSPKVAGRAAFLGGTLGKGKVFVAGPNPERDERTYDMVCSAIEYLTGVRPHPVSHDRRRGALSVALSGCCEKTYANACLKELVRDRRVDVRFAFDRTALQHLDAVVIGNPKKDEFGEALRRFVENGGTVYAVANTPAKAEAVAAWGDAKKMERVVVLGSHAEIPAALGALCGCPCEQARLVADAESPDGRNEIRLYVNPLSYEIVRSGDAVVPRTPIGLEIDGQDLAANFATAPAISRSSRSGMTPTPVYKKALVMLDGNETFVDFGTWGVRLVARDDGVAWRFETAMDGEISVTHERAGLSLSPDAQCHAAYATGCGSAPCSPEARTAADLPPFDPKHEKSFCMPLVFKNGDTVVGVDECDLCDFPVWNMARMSPTNSAGTVALESVYGRWPTSVVNDSGASREAGARRERRWLVRGRDRFLTRCDGQRTFPWRCFALADEYAKLCESDLAYALARSNDDPLLDFSWVNPGKVARGQGNAGNSEGHTTKACERSIDFASSNGVEYVILDEGWSENHDIWKFHPSVDVPHLVKYAAERNVGIVLQLAWAQADGDEDRVAEHFAKIGVRGFCVNSPDRTDAQAVRFVWKFSDACARNNLLVDWHGAHRLAGMCRAYPNVANCEAAKPCDSKEDCLGDDVKRFFTRESARRANRTRPDAVGTLSRQMALVPMFGDSPRTLCGKNRECFDFVVKAPVVWDDVKGLGGTPDTYAAVARKAKDGSWWVSAITNWEPREIDIDTSFLDDGKHVAEMFCDADDCDAEPTHYVRQLLAIEGGEVIRIKLATGGGAAIRIK